MPLDGTSRTAPATLGFFAQLSQLVHAAAVHTPDREGPASGTAAQRLLLAGTRHRAVLESPALRRALVEHLSALNPDLIESLFDRDLAMLRLAGAPTDTRDTVCADLARPDTGSRDAGAPHASLSVWLEALLLRADRASAPIEAALAFYLCLQRALPFLSPEDVAPLMTAASPARRHDLLQIAVPYLRSPATGSSDVCAGGASNAA